MSFLDEIASLIMSLTEQQPLPAGHLVIGELLEDLDTNQVVLYELPGQITQRRHDIQGASLVTERGRVVVRGRGQSEARDEIEDIWLRVFNGQIRNTYVQGVRYLALDAESKPAFTARDGQNRFLYAFPFRALKVPSA